MEKELTFEEKLNNLEKIVKELENGDVLLDDAINKFNEAMNLANSCNKTLEEATQLILNFIAQAFSHISIESFIKINIKDDFSTKNIVSYISNPNETNPEEVQNNLKRISYDYFRRTADKVKTEIQSIYSIFPYT